MMFTCFHWQFYRSFPKLPETTDEDIALLVNKYRDPDRAGLLNYLNLANDIDVIGDIMDNEKKVTLHNIGDINDYLPHRVRMLPFTLRDIYII